MEVSTWKYEFQRELKASGGHWRLKKTEQNRSGSVGWETTGTKDWIIPQRSTVSAEVRLCLGGISGLRLWSGTSLGPRLAQASLLRITPLRAPQPEACVRSQGKGKQQWVLKGASRGSQESWRQPSHWCGRRLNWFKTKQTQLLPLLRD